MAHPEVTRRNRRAAIERRHERMRAYIRMLRAEGTCADCGDNPGADLMDFDHVPGRGEKVASISDLGAKWTGWATLRAELAKCDLVCKPCHCRRTMARQGKVYVRLTGADREAILRGYATGRRQADLARKFGVSQGRIPQMVHKNAVEQAEAPVPSGTPRRRLVHRSDREGGQGG